MIRIALILALLITPTAWAQTDVRLAYVLRTQIVPTANGLSSVDGLPVVQVAPADCVSLLTDALADMHSEEEAKATLLGRTRWTHKSYASCLFVRAEFAADPSVAAQPEETCVLTFVDEDSWRALCP